MHKIAIILNQFFYTFLGSDLSPDQCQGSLDVRWDSLGIGNVSFSILLKWCSFQALEYPKNAANWKPLKPFFLQLFQDSIPKLQKLRKQIFWGLNTPRLVACVTRLCPMRGKRKQKCWIASIGFVHCSHLRSKFSSDDTEKPKMTLTPCHLWALFTVPSRWREAFQSSQQQFSYSTLREKTVSFSLELNTFYWKECQQLAVLCSCYLNFVFSQGLCN